VEQRIYYEDIDALDLDLDFAPQDSHPYIMSELD
jgi:hypothetical protein